MGFTMASISGQYNQARLIIDHPLEVSKRLGLNFQRIARNTVLLVNLIMRGVEREVPVQSVDVIISQVRQLLFPAL
jgi:hypothetical protein